MAMDYFTKWVEAEPVASITKREVRSSFGRTLLQNLGCEGQWSLLMAASLMPIRYETILLNMVFK